MKPFYVATDWHLAAIRSGGTTPQSAWGLRRYLIASAERLLAQIDGDLVFAGDLFDSAQVPNFELLETVRIFSDWFRKGHSVYFIRSNHDIHRVTTTLSSFDLFGSVLTCMFPRQVTVITEPTDTPYGHVVPHLLNQDLFNLALEKVPPTERLFLHCNVNNKFAQEQEHSLNITLEQAQKAPAKQIIVGHEHQHKTHLGGRVLVLGNSFPSSVADALGNNEKFYAVITGDKIELVPCWEAKGSFQRIDWHAMQEVSPGAQFVRVEGEASASEAATVVALIAKLRSTHNAFVISNAVKIEGRDTDEERLSLEEIQSYNVMDALLRRLKPEWQTKVRALLETGDAAQR